jgi:pilus assembly protein CpaF
MFTIIISEKGGADRREAFDRNEINVGRVQGNDLMLAKGNVSKHHARLLFRDGRFIVTDLKSTNGTYVNGRKISQATIVREGDKIYVGDFVLRLETGRAEAQEVAAQGTPARGSARVPATTRAASASSPPIERAPAPVPSGQASAAASGSGSSPVSPIRRATEGQSSVSHVSHFPLEREPDSESAPDLLAEMAPSPGVPKADSSPSSPDRTGPTPVSKAADSSSVSRAPAAETARQAAHRRALATLLDRVADAVDLTILATATTVDPTLSQRIEVAVQSQAKGLRSSGEVDSIDVDQLARDAVRELLGLGPLGPLLEDDDTSEIHVARFDSVLAVGSGQPAFSSPPFSSEESLARAVRRLVAQSGEPVRPGEGTIERKLARGGSLVALAPSVAGRWVVTIRKRRRVQASLVALRRARALSGAMLAFLEACAEARSNVLVVGGGGAAVASTIAALLAAAKAGERIALIGRDDEIAVGDAVVIPLPEGPANAGAESVAASVRLGVDRIVVPSFAGAVVPSAIEAIGAGCGGVVAGVSAPSLRQALARLVVQLAMARPGTSLEAAREAVGTAFDVAIELSKPEQGRLRIQRLAELDGADVNGVVVRDLFVATRDASSSDSNAASFVSTGARPQLLQSFAARGIKLDDALFKRTKPQAT